MKTINRFKVLSFFLIAAYLLAACGGTLPATASSTGAPKVQANDVVFTGVVEAINASQWMVSGQQINMDASTAVDPDIQIGDVVKVEASVSQDGTVLAVKVEASIPDDNANSGNDNSAITPNDNSGNSNANPVDDNSNAANDNGNSAASSATAEVLGAVEDITVDAIVINGVTYGLASFTEFKGVIAVGDQVKIHVIVNADGTLTIREIERTAGGAGDDNSNANVNDDNSNSSNSNDNGNSSNSNDDNDDNPNDSGGNSNDDYDYDDNSNDNDD
jgi:hypothetical protein